MFYPILKINQNDSVSMEIIDTDQHTDPYFILEGQDSESIIEEFWSLLTILVTQYEEAYDEGYERGFEDAEGEDEEYSYSI